VLSRTSETENTSKSKNQGLVTKANWKAIQANKEVPQEGYKK
jgi:hypothetical protein